MGNSGDGVVISGNAHNIVVGSPQTPNVIPENTIGGNLGNGENGIKITNGLNNSIGRGPNSTKSDQETIIAHNGFNGVQLVSGSGNSILDNSIFANTSFGILLSAGANLNQAAPSLTSADVVNNKLNVTGSLTSTPKKAFTIQFFANDSMDPSGQFFLGQMKVTTKANGTIDFVFKTTNLPPSGADFITATATDSKGNTSQFSLAVQDS
jgi:hypothetical protein